MAGFLDNSRLDIACPLCAARVATTLGRARRSPTVRCPRGHSIRVEASQLDRELRKTDRAFDDLRRTLRRLGR